MKQLTTKLLYLCPSANIRLSLIWLSPGPCLFSHMIPTVKKLIVLGPLTLQALSNPLSVQGYAVFQYPHRYSCYKHPAHSFNEVKQSQIRSVMI